ncbi:hypothetical protein GCM10010869_47970 [Mesorhizobium tianshanense]|uniref:Uncharacterized protein n=1 Tax=Mesorhizobium tianshanense TaxID=39844 RepID=A0A562NT09_9HYPH|nr:hypothetical protein [Mesorhizobium tianshanense]TWI35295.1 hypothetical protein IQ26_03275 [Mesorhizobium tianshanense]GLS39200.1 hypothetical protein GCM10010869_47970 [Mesorhizobium tianshanense]
MIDHAITTAHLYETASRLVGMGYTPLYAIDKRCAAWGWATSSPVPEWLATAYRKKQFIVDKDGLGRRKRKHPKNPGEFIIEHGWWCRPQAIALRLEDGLAAIDFDINDPIIETVIRRVLDAVPALYDAMVRMGGGVKEAHFCLAGPDADFYRMQSSHFCRPGADPHGETVETHMVEIFGGGGQLAWRNGVFRKPAKYFGAFFAHTVEMRTQNILRDYSWIEGYSPLTVPRSSLPVLSMADFKKVLEIVEATLIEHGWQVVPRSGIGDPSGRTTYVYDLTDGMDIDGYTLADLYRMAENGEIGGIRIDISPVPWLRKSSNSGKSCCLTVTSRGVPGVMDWSEMVIHLPASLQPGDVSALADKLQKLTGARQGVDAVDLLAGTLVELVAEIARKKVGRHDNR